LNKKPNSNLGPILPVSKILQVFFAKTATPLLFHPNFGGAPLD